uniref:Uncharacterized protein n=1 Tax=Oryzias sinensis TaxID=183150 RepID=A0A8C7WX41_9TELE
MAGEAWLESSLRRSAILGLEVLERASRRSVDWTNGGASHTSTLTRSRERSCTELSDAFATIADFMDKTTCQCRVSEEFMHMYVLACWPPTTTFKAECWHFFLLT